MFGRSCCGLVPEPPMRNKTNTWCCDRQLHSAGLPRWILSSCAVCSGTSLCATVVQGDGDLPTFSFGSQLLAESALADEKSGIRMNRRGHRAGRSHVSKSIRTQRLRHVYIDPQQLRMFFTIGISFLLGRLGRFQPKVNGFSQNWTLALLLFFSWSAHFNGSHQVEL